MKQGELLNEVKSLLGRHGFRSATAPPSLDFCFNIVASSGNTSLVIKAVNDLNDVSREQMEELCAISNWARAKPMLLAERKGDEELDDDAVYLKDRVYALSPEALRRTLEGDPPLVEVGPTGYFVYINGELLKRRREELGLSVGELARLAGVSRMTIYSYEKGRRRTSPSVAYRLEYVLGVPLVVPINALTANEDEVYEAPEACGSERGDALRGGLLGTVLELMRKMKLIFMAFMRAPFEVMVRHGELRAVMNVVHDEDYDESRIIFTREFTDIMGISHLVVKPEGYECPGNVPSISLRELESMRSPEELTKVLTA